MQTCRKKNNFSEKRWKKTLEQTLAVAVGTEELAVSSKMHVKRALPMQSCHPCTCTVHTSVSSDFLDYSSACFDAPSEHSEPKTGIFSSLWGHWSTAGVTCLEWCVCVCARGGVSCVCCFPCWVTHGFRKVRVNSKLTLAAWENKAVRRAGPEPVPPLRLPVGQLAGWAWTRICL